MVRLALTQDIGAEDSPVIQLPKTSNKIGRKGDAAENPRSKRKMSVLAVVYNQNAVSVRIDGGSSRKYLLPFSWIPTFDSYMQELLYALIDHFFGSSVRWGNLRTADPRRDARESHYPVCKTQVSTSPNGPHALRRAIRLSYTSCRSGVLQETQ